jgi:altronate hydrolase
MDFNAGDVLDGTRSIDELGADLFELMLETASGRPSRSERHGYGQQEFVPWQLSVVT